MPLLLGISFGADEDARLAPIRRRRRALAGEPGYLRSVLRAGNERARAIASTTLDGVHELMHASY